jgi:SPP1 family predicted phage head-tail adaptor
MPAGDLDRRVKLDAPVVARDTDFGSEVTTWNTVATVWAKLMERMAGEGIEADQRVMTRQITIRIRYRSDVLTTWRVVCGTRRFRINGTLEVGRREYLHLLCEETSDA